ncbi:Tudor/PWWP/MBT [Pholiota conissans]|uniref:Tudor/PWWP/MBT n=1 Tax=Pholiota conissans TaxID=109636 RepID=A0A9P5YVN5_9AGAR|nr:Tudor/PWWP/MBT [Pholiota conissans]
MSSNKKSAAKSAKEVRQYVIGDPVLGKMRGYPPWPGIVVDPADAPPAVQQQQPPNKKSSAYCILFFPMGDYGWLNPKELSFLQRHEIEAFLADDAKKRNGELREGYRIALDPQPWLAARIAAEAAQQDAEDNAQVDQLASDEDEEGAGATTPDGEDDDEGGAKSKKSRKRKRESEPASKKEKAPAKSRAKKGSAEPKVPKKTEKKPRKSASGRSKALVESEDEGAGAGAEEPLSAAPITAKGATSPPPAKKARRDAKGEDEEGKAPEDPESVKVRDWRHKLQKTFLSNKTPPKPEVRSLSLLFFPVSSVSLAFRLSSDPFGAIFLDFGQKFLPFLSLLLFQLFCTCLHYCLSRSMLPVAV